jgi:hypothetical protein
MAWDCEIPWGVGCLALWLNGEVANARGTSEDIAMAWSLPRSPVMLVAHAAPGGAQGSGKFAFVL